jgi:hypothetical protein
MSAVNRSWIQSEVARSPSEGHNWFTLCVLNRCPLSTGLFKIFQKAPAPTGAFWFPLFAHLTEILPLLQPIPYCGITSAALADTQVAGNTITHTLSSQRKELTTKPFFCVRECTLNLAGDCDEQGL